jgi:hypothetical protein
MSSSYIVEALRRFFVLVSIPILLLGEELLPSYFDMD